MNANTAVNTEGFTMLCEAGCRHELCQNCAEPFRLHNQLAKDHPGTVVGVKAVRLCQGCIKSRDRGGAGRRARSPLPENCLRCSEKLRPSKTSAEDHPGTKSHRGKGLCGSCYDATAPDDREAYIQRYTQLNLLPNVDARLETAARGVYDLMAHRRKRGVPQGGQRGAVKIV